MSHPFRLGLVVTLLGTYAGAHAQAVIQSLRFDQTVSTNDGVASVVRDGGGNYFVVTSTRYGAIVTKHNSVWTGQWKRLFLGGNSSSVTPATAVLDPSGDLILIGTKSGVINGNNVRSLTTLRLAADDGRTLYETHPLGSDVTVQSITPASVDASGKIGFTLQYFPSDNSGPTYRMCVVDYTNGSLKWSVPIFGTNQSGYPSRARPDVGGDWYVAGNIYASDQSHNGAALWRFRATDGAPQWRYDRLPQAPTGYGQANDLAFEPDGSVVVVGTEWLNNTDRDDLLAVRVNAASGAAIWASKQRLSPYSDGANVVKVDAASGDVLLAGYDGSGSNGTTLCALRLRAIDGGRSWYTRYDSTSIPTGGTDIVLDGSGVMVVQSQGFSYGQGISYVYTVALNGASGGLLWGNRFPTPYGKDDSVRGTFADGDSVVVVGSTDSGSARLHDVFFQRLGKSSGAQQGLSVVDDQSSGDETIYSSAVASDGSSVIASVCAGDEPNGYDVRTIVILRNADGSIRWRRLFEKGEVAGVLAHPAFCHDGSVVFGGRNANVSAMTATKLSGVDGSTIWQGTYSDAVYSDYDVFSIAVAPNDDVVVTGPVNTDIMTVRFTAANGAVLWAKPFKGGQFYSNTPSGVLVNAAGDVFVGGMTGNGTYSALLLKLKGTDGSQLWMKTQQTNNARDRQFPGAVLLTPEEDVVLTGNTQDYGGLTRSMYAFKFAGIDGALKWSKVYATANSIGQAAAVLTPTGDLLTLAGDGTSTRFFKLGATDGAVKWSQALEGTGTYSYVPTDLVSDASGNLVAIGYGNEYNSPVVTPYLLSLSSADGHTLWQQPYSYSPTVTPRARELKRLADGNLLLLEDGPILGPNRVSSDLFIVKLDPAPRTVSGTVQFQDFVGANLPSFVVQFRNAGTSTVVSTQTITVAADGSFSAPLLPADGTYDVTIKASHWIRKRILNLAVSGTKCQLGAISLVNGDVNGDNKVDAADQVALTAAFRSRPGSGNWNPDADLNGDGQVTATDQAILSKNFGKASN